jgi:hypothetical protein
MKQLFTLLALTIALITTSCEDCGECFTPPFPFIFELVNEEGENIFTNESFNQHQLSIVRTSNEQNLEYQLISENEHNYIEIGSIGWTTEQVKLSFRLDETEVFTFYVNAIRKTEDCCAYTKYDDIILEGANYVRNERTGIFKVTVQ